MANQDEKGKERRNDLFKRLTSLFSGGPSVKKKVRAFRTQIPSTATEVFKKSYSQIYSNALNSYGSYDRMCIDINGLHIAVPGKEGFKSIKDLMSLYPNGEKFLVYSYDHKLGHITPAWAHHPRSSGFKETVKVTFDDGSHIICTHDHPCMMRDGSYRDAGQLIAGDSMMPFYRKQFNGTSKQDGKKFYGYRSVYTCGQMDGSWKGWISEHRLIAEWSNNRKLLKGVEHIHHIDHDPENNDPSNLEFVNAKEHMSEHGKIGALIWKTHREKLINALKDAWARDDGTRRAGVAKVNQRADVREKRRLSAILNNPSKTDSRRAEISNAMNARVNAARDLYASMSLAQRQELYESFNGDLKALGKHFHINSNVIIKLLKQDGIIKNHTVVSVEPNGIIEVGDLTVDGYENFATDTIFVHNSRYADFSEMELTPEIASALDIYCLASNNVIPLLDGRNLTIGELFEKNEENFWVYSFDINQQKIVPGLCKKVRKTGLNQQIYKVNFDDGTFVRLTSNHRVLLKAGNYVEVKNLKEGDSIESLHKNLSYELNTRIASIILDGHEDVYDLEVIEHHNFAVGIGSLESFVFVHNSEEATSTDDKSSVIKVYSNNSKIQTILDELFHDTLNLEYNLTPWTRNLVKYGDFFLFIDIHPEQGVLNTFPIPINEIEREEGFDPENPLATRYRWVTHGNQMLESWQIAHFRLLGNDAFLPYGSSVLESARRIWRQLILIEDAMLVYRVVRSPERRVFYIDVGAVPTEQIPTYMEAAQSKLKRAPVVDKATGRMDLRYNPLSVDEDYFIPIRGTDSGTKN